MSVETTEVTTRRRRRVDPTSLGGKETHAPDLHNVPTRETILSLDADPEHGEEIVVAEGPLNKAYQDALAFYEEPVSLRINPSSEKNAPKFHECWVNGRGIEFLTEDGKWRVNYPGVAPGYVPVGVNFTTKRKYAEVLLRKRQDEITTDVQETPGQDPVNKVLRQNLIKAPVTIIRDASPKGAEWLMRIMAES